MTQATTTRYDSLDLLKGLVMVLMTFDHARNFFYVADGFTDPLQIDVLSTHEFFLRWITHLCAPGFVLLAGMAIWIKAQRVEHLELFKNELFKRGLILIALEVTIINFCWGFELIPSMIYLQVIWAIGLSFIVMSMLLGLSAKLMGLIGLIIMFWHGFLVNMLAEASIDSLLIGFVAPKIYLLGLGSAATTLYPLLPWLGIMMAGYYLASISLHLPSSERCKRYVIIGSSAIVLFVILRWIGVAEWNPDAGSFLSFINVTKYPPSLSFMLLTLGIILLLLAWFERYPNGNILRVLGRKPLIYYLIHLYVLRFSAEVLKVFGVGMEGDAWVGMPLIVVYSAALATIFACYYAFKSKAS